MSGVHDSLSSSADDDCTLLLPFPFAAAPVFPEAEEDLSLSLPPSVVLPPSHDTARDTLLRFPWEEEAAPELAAARLALLPEGPASSESSSMGSSSSLFE
jgi:hypothetical protein